jgi:hypothetical protein
MSSIWDKLCLSLSSLYYDEYDNEVAPSRSGTGGGYSKETPCCAVVVCPLTLVALLGLLTGGTFFLNMLITKTLAGGGGGSGSGASRSRRRRMDVSSHVGDVLYQGKS